LSAPEIVCLDVLRLVCVAVSTENVEVHDAAHVEAEAKLGTEIGGGLVRRVSLLVSALARERPGEFLVMPCGSALVTPDELAVLSAVRAARFTNREILAKRVDDLAHGQDAGGVFHEVVALAIALSAIEHCGEHCGASGSDQYDDDGEAGETRAQPPSPPLRVLH
jgi:hypothetical protein